ncbi:MAG: hypothetical protein US86_C0001G0222 [Candidatus Daviesbacteria bacterium GW2011_GWA2_38_24]|uniref:Uncharacterized protein n=1 Tax=Candidatus Daviesbacteria bacterium GW2011_GWA2_38_24 TaxID=1618422 RepID=A0A0G0JW19_9BACT|nr:MAG: hypothetical protein US86_C0001G0222 [Candidatus Daviesbacteria bacterium GW2011_GWA2_38_24]
MDNNNQSAQNNNPNLPVDLNSPADTDLNTPVATQMAEPTASDMLNQATTPDWNTLQTSVDSLNIPAPSLMTTSDIPNTPQPADTFTPNFDPNQPFTPQTVPETPQLPPEVQQPPSIPPENPTPPTSIPTWPPVQEQTPPLVDNAAAVQSVVATLQGQTPQPIPPVEEPAPTDLSQLSASSPTGVPTTIYTPPVSSDSLVINQKPIPEVAGATQSKIPLKLIITGVLVLLLVTAASVYFLFFANGAAPETSSLPAETQDQTPLTNPPGQLPQNALVPPGGTEMPATPTAQIQPDPEATNGATQTFGTLNKGSSTPSASPTSALELLRQRQQQSNQQ